MRTFAVLLVCLAGLLLATPIAADDIPRLESQITDHSNARVLASERARIEAALDELLRTDSLQLWVAFVETTGTRTATEFADETADVNSLGGNDVLLLVALTDRSYALWRSDEYLDRLSDRELSDVGAQRIEPRLRAADYVGAVVECAGGLALAVRTIEGAATPTPSERAPGLDFGFVVPLAVVGGGVILLWAVVTSRRRESAAAAARERRDAERAREANALLIRADEALRDAQEEMGYAEAQFTPADVAPYREAVAAASTELRAAFTIRQQLDDAIPEDSETRRRLVEDLVARATKALGLLEEQRRRVEEMRELERRAPELLASLRDDIAAASARLPDADRTVAGFRRYAESSWSSVKSNAADARDLLGRASAHVAEGEAASGSGDAAGAAKAVREAQHDLTEAARLIDAIATVATAIREAEAAVRDRLATATADVEHAGATLARASSEERERRLGEARAALAGAQQAMAAAAPDVLGAVKLAAQAEGGADAILAEVRKEEERREREARLAATQLRLALDAYRRASDYIAPRRRAVGSTPRTRLAEAERHLANAEQLASAGHLAAAMPEAQRAQRLADEAWSLAQEDLREAETQGPWTGFPRGGPVIIPFPFPMGGGHSRPAGGGFRPPISIPRPGGRSVGGRW